MCFDLGEEHGLEFLLGEGGELVDSLFVGVGRVGVVFFDGFEIFLEDAKPIFNFFGRDVNEVSKLVSPFLEQF